MAIALRFNGQQFYSDLRDRLVVAMNEVNSAFFQAATSGMSAEAKADSEKEPARIESTTDYKVTLDHTEQDEEYINARCRFYADAILESFGMGSLADRGEFSQWDEYEKSDFFNPARKSTMNIVGRPKGPYTDIWGNDRYSTGGKEGQNLESKSGSPRRFFDKQTGKWVTIAPKKGTYAIQNVEVWLMQNRETSMERRIKLEVEKFISEMSGNPLKYFYYVEE